MPAGVHRNAGVHVSEAFDHRHSYLLIRILENLDRGPERFLDWDLKYPLKNLSGRIRYLPWIIL